MGRQLVDRDGNSVERRLWLEDLEGIIAVLGTLVLMGGGIVGAVFLFMWHWWMLPVCAVVVVLGFFLAIRTFDGWD